MMFIDLKPDKWTLIVSTWQPQKQFNPSNREALWGAYGYTPDKDVVRAPMTLTTLPYSVDQLTWAFLDMTDAGGRLALMWDTQMAAMPFLIGKGVGGECSLQYPTVYLIKYYYML